MCRLVDRAEVDKLIRAQERAITVIAKEGLPRFFVRALVDLEDAVSGVSKADTKTMSQANAKAYTRVKQTMKKYAEKFTAQIAAYRATPDRPDEAPETSKKAATARKAAVDDESSEDEVVIGRENGRATFEVAVSHTPSTPRTSHRHGRAGEASWRRGVQCQGQGCSRS